jgi:cytochrome P450
MIELPILFIHHVPDTWGSDVNDFKSKRFAEGISKGQRIRAHSSHLAGAICIGQNFALLEAKMAISMILQRFEFELVPTYTHAPHTVMTLLGAQIKLRAYIHQWCHVINKYRSCMFVDDMAPPMNILDGSKSNRTAHIIVDARSKPTNINDIH